MKCNLVRDEKIGTKMNNDDEGVKVNKQLIPGATKLIRTEETTEETGQEVHFHLHLQMVVEEFSISITDLRDKNTI